MSAVMSELPLMLFTALAPVSAGAFVALALAFATTKFSDDQLKKIDRMTAIPLVVLFAGFVCSFFHLANPLHVLGVFAGTGSSPLSNELLAGALFTALAVVYWACSLAGKLRGMARVALAAVLAVASLAFVCLIGAAYMVDTIVSWNTPLSIVQMLGYALLGGTALGVLVIGLSGSLDTARTGSFRSAAFTALGAGLALAVVGVCVQVARVSSLSNALASGAILAAEATAPLVIGVVLMVAAAAAAFFALRGKGSRVLMATAPALATVGVFSARLVFYSVQMSAGICIS